MMGTNRRTYILLCVFLIVLTVCLVKATDEKPEESEGIREITVVTIAPKVPDEKEEYINFDLQHLAIVGRDTDDISGTEISGRDSEESGADSEQPGEDIEGTGGNEEEGTGDPEGTGEYQGDDAAGEGEASTGENNLPDNGADGDTLPELVESESVSKTELERQLGEYSGFEDGYSDGYTDESEMEAGVGDSGLTYLGTYTATAYCACPICTGEYSTGYTASGTLATEGRTVACNTLPFGTEIYIEGYGYYVVEDTGWSPYGDAWIDIFFESHDSALAFGLRNVEVYLVN